MYIRFIQLLPPKKHRKTANVQALWRWWSNAIPQQASRVAELRFQLRCLAVSTNRKTPAQRPQPATSSLSCPKTSPLSDALCLGAQPCASPTFQIPAQEVPISPQSLPFGRHLLHFKPFLNELVPEA